MLYGQAARMGIIEKVAGEDTSSRCETVTEHLVGMRRA